MEREWMKPHEVANMSAEVKCYTPPEVAAILKVTVPTILNYLKAGKMKGFKAANKWRIREVDLVEFMKKGGVMDE